MLRKNKIAIIIGLIITLFLSFCGLAQAQPSDIQGHWAQSQISVWVDKGLAQGYPDGSFKPDNTISRAEFISLTNHAFAFTAATTSSFSDVTANDWFVNEIAKSQAAGYITGYQDGTMRPNQGISRQEVATIIAKIAKLDTANNTALNSIKDASDIPEWSRGAIAAVVAKDLMHGYPDQTFRAQNSISRAEAIISLNNLSNANIVPAQAVKIYDKAGVYGPSSGVETITGDLIISVAAVTLQNCIISGNLTLAQGIGEGDVSLRNVSVQGMTYIKGGGANSVTLENCTLPSVTISKAGVRVVASGSTSVSIVKLENGANLLETSVTGSGFATVTLAEIIPAGATITLTGSFDKVNVAAANVNVTTTGANIAQLDVTDKASGSKVNLDSSSKVNTLSLNAAVSVTGQGTIGTAQIGASGTNIEQKPGTIENPQNYSFSSNTGTTSSGSNSAQITTISDVELNNTFGSFKFSTNIVTTADNILAKVKVNGFSLKSVGQRNDGDAGKAWKAFVTDPENDKDYTITCESPFTLTGTSIVRWPSVISASAATDIEVEDIGDSKNGSDLQVSFSKAVGENQKIASYRVMVVGSASASAFNLAAANAVSAVCYTVVAKTGADNYTITLDGAKDTAGNSITNGIAYKVFVLSIADGTNAVVNGLSIASNTITLNTTPSGGSGGGGPAPVGLLTIADGDGRSSLNAKAPNGPADGAQTDRNVMTFKLSADAVESINIGSGNNITLAVSSITGLTATDLINIELYTDPDKDGNPADGVAIAAGSLGAIDAGNATITFNVSSQQTIAASTSMNYIVQLDTTANWGDGDTFTFGTNSINIVATGATSNETVSCTGAIGLRDFVNTATSIAATNTSYELLSLSESNLNGNQIRIKVTGDAFKSTVAITDFQLNNAPPGLTISGFAKVSGTSNMVADLTLTFDATDFDTDINNFSIKVKASGLNSGQALTTANITILAKPTGSLTIADGDGRSNLNAKAPNGPADGAQTDRNVMTFKLSADAVESINIGSGNNITLAVSNITGLTATDLINIELYTDPDKDGNPADGVAIAAGSLGAIDAGNATITFNVSSQQTITASTSMNYIVQLDTTANWDDGDTFTFAANSLNIAATGATSSETVSCTGAIGERAFVNSATSIAATNTNYESLSLNESNLDGNKIRVKITGDAYVSAVAITDFQLNNAPTGLAISRLAKVSGTSNMVVDITLTFDGTDFDTDINNFSIKVKASGLNSGQALTTANITILAIVE